MESQDPGALTISPERRPWLGVPFKAHPRGVDDLSMMIIPNYAQQAENDEPPDKGEDEVDRYQGIGDRELEAALDRCLRQMNGLGQESTSPAGTGVDHEVEQIQGELLRRARARHPSTY